jgi:coenzyme PQQ precursor peptide PqqA
MAFSGNDFADQKLASNGYTMQVFRPVLERIEIMEWTAPTFEEVALNCEINSYASAAL